MKRLSAITLVLLLAWVQIVVAMAEPSGGCKAPACCACDRSCCVEQSTDSAPQPVAPAPTASQSADLQLFSIVTSLAWTLPGGEVATFSTDLSSLASADSVPLFQRNCTLLI